MKTSCLVLCSTLLLVSLAGEGLAQGSTQAHWPQWRGPFFNGLARGDAPTEWNDTKNIKWKANIPGRGFSTPVIWGDKIFLTTAVPTGKPAAQPTTVDQAPTANPQGGRGRGPGGDAGPQAEHRFDVLALDRKTGKLLWQKTAKVAVPHEGYHRTYGSFASNSPSTDGRYLYVSFGSRGIYCYDFNGKLIWEKDLAVQMKMRLAFGEGSAPLLMDDRLIAVFDHEGGGSFIVALDKRTGKELWRVPRDEGSSWSTPLAIQHNGRTQVVVPATRKVRSYDPKNGNVLWEAAGLGSNVIPVPVYSDGLVYVMSGHRDPRLMAVKLGKEGDLTNSDSIVWNHTRGLAYTTSPVLHENKLYVVTDNGMVSAFNAVTGEPFYAQVRLPGSYNFKASPVAANGKLYLATENEDVVVLKLGEKFEVLATNKLTDQVFIATPVIADGEIFLRGQNTLFCISEKK
jgi:outer membrane protein assembly factor BamB